MKFWEDMQSKWGFNDGNAIPEGVEDYRTVYIRAVNRLAEQLNSQVRAVAYNRPGLHNYCLVIFYKVTDLQDISVEQYAKHVDIHAPVVEPDEAMREAIWQAYEAQLDNFLQITVEIDPELDDFITALKSFSDEDPLILTVLGEPQHIYLEGKIEVISPNWIIEHNLDPLEKHIFTVKQIYHHDGMLVIHHTKGQQYIISAHLVRVRHIPNIHREANIDQSPIPPYRVEAVEVDESLVADAEADIADLYFNYIDALDALKRVHKKTAGEWEIVNGYGNTCLLMSADQSLIDNKTT